MRDKEKIMGFRVDKTATKVNVKLIIRSDWSLDENGEMSEQEQFRAFAEFVDDSGNVVEEWQGNADKIASEAQIDKLRTILTWLKTEAEKEL